MSFIEQVTGFINSVPRIVIVTVAFIVIMGIFLIWKKMSSQDKEVPAPVVKVEPKPEEKAPLIQAPPPAPVATIVNPVVPDVPKELEPYGPDSDSDDD
jgi:hypothetical protein